MKKICSVLFLISFSISTYSQKLEKANKQFEKFAYIDAINTYERLFDKGYKSTQMLKNLGNAYYFNAELDKASKWYSELFSYTKNIENEYYYRYAQSLKAINEYKKADDLLAKFYVLNKNDLRAKLVYSHKDYLQLIEKNSGRYTIENLKINSDKSDFGTTIFNNNLIFASSRENNSLYYKKHLWTNERYTNLYKSEIQQDGTLSDVLVFDKNLNSKFNESTPIFTKDGKTIYFTRNNYLKGKKGKDNEKVTLLKLYKATLINDKWANIKELPFNSNQYSVAHPALSADDKTLYFASNMPGSFGQSDIFKVSINDDGSFGEPINLGNSINTEGRESFPFISNENELYFATDGHPGLGGFDIFVSKLDINDNYANVLNIGKPINSSNDDFAFFINNKTNIGYFSSNRNGGKGNDDIYKFTETKKIDFLCEQLLFGILTNFETNTTLENVKVTLFDIDYNKIAEEITKIDGNFNFGKVNCGTKFYIRAEKNEFITNETPVETANITGKTFVPISLEKSIKTIKIGQDLAKAFGIKEIYFDLDKAEIRPDAALEIAKILDVLEHNPTMEIAIKSHTDCRQTAQYNLDLSERRAKSTKNWLISNGIANSRITAKGFGESQLLNDCKCEPTNESSCTEKQHQENRRSEFIITKL